MSVRRAARTKAIDERSFHEWLARELPAGRHGLLPLGDDAAAIRPPPGTVAVLSIDSLVEGTHFRRASPPERIGAAAAAVSLSDLAAKGAEPTALLLAIVVPVGTPQEWAESVTRGARQMAEPFGMELVGGDTKPGPVRTVVSSVVGWARSRSLAPRTAARPGDLLVTTGTVGRGGAAATRLLRTRRPDRSALVEMLDVRPRVREGIILARWAHAMLDTSDGIAESARLLAAASGVRVEVDWDRLPLAPALRLPKITLAERKQRAFYGGDYELLLTIAPRVLRAAERAVEGTGGMLTVVGCVKRGHGAWLVSSRGTVPMPPSGWRPFGRSTPRHP